MKPEKPNTKIYNNKKKTSAGLRILAAKKERKTHTKKIEESMNKRAQFFLEEPTHVRSRKMYDYRCWILSSMKSECMM